MKFPKINKQPMRSVTVPELSGGINLRDGVSRIRDNQLTDAKNMWYKDNMLKTRPGLYTNESMTHGTVMLNESCIGHPTDITMTRNGALYRLFYYELEEYHSPIEEDSLSEYDTEYGMFWISAEKVISLPKLPGRPGFATQFKNKIYVFMAEGSIYTRNTEDTQSDWTMVSENEIYAPFVMIHCQPDGHPRQSSSTLTENKAIMFEGYNLLSGYYRMLWSTYGKNAVLTEIDGKMKHPMWYTLLYKASDFVGKTVTVKITHKNGSVVEHSVTIASNQLPSVETENRGDGLYLRVAANMLSFVTSPGGNEYAYISEDEYVEDNMEIRAPCPNPAENRKKVFSMRRTVWFGGDAAGISGGSRLFLCGNTEQKEKNLVLWSGLNNPLYFPENCYAYVGNSDQEVTAFGRQEDTLVIFKEREIFYTRYMRNNEIKAENLIRQEVVDYTASAVYFPMVQLHAQIGCDCPDTVQLCRNRLVWTCRDGNVYTLVSQNQYSERTVYCVSGMIARRLSTEDLKNAWSADWSGHYCLLIGEHMYLMNYESYGFVNAAYYTKTEDAQALIPWWYWELTTKIGEFGDGEAVAAFASGGELFHVIYDAAGRFRKFIVRRLSFDCTEDAVAAGEKTPISSSFTTKIFDFGAPQTVKNVPLCRMSFGNNGGRPIEIFYLTEQGEERAESVVLSESGADEYTAEFVHSRALRPCVRLIGKLGIRVSCEGAMYADGMTVEYRILGGVK